MKKFVFIGFCFLFMAATVIAQKKETKEIKEPKKTITVENIWKEYKFFARSASGFNFLKNGTHYTRLEGVHINEYSIATGEKTATIYSADAKLQVSSYTFSEDEQKLLLESDPEQIYRHSSRANFYVFDRKSQKITPLSEKGKQRYATFNPQGDKVAFVRDNNLFYKDLNSEIEVQVTQDGEINKILNGATDWVYEEEFSIDKVFFWSPDGSQIAFLRLDESKVKQFTLTYFYNELYPNESTFKYPKAGEDNSEVSVHIYHLAGKNIVKMNVGGTADQYIPRLKWTLDNRLCIYRLNRHQNELTLLLANSQTGECTELMTETNKCYIDIDDHLTFLEGNLFVWISEQDGFKHIYLYNIKGKKMRQLTKGEFDITNFYGVDTKNKRVYFQAAGEKSRNREVYWVSLEGGAMNKLSTQEGTNAAEFGSTFEYYINTYSNVTTPPVYAVYQTEGNKMVRMIEDNQLLTNALATYDMGEHRYFSFTSSEKVLLNGWMMLPPNFNEKTKYPVFMYVYGGPGAPTTGNKWDNGNHMWFRMLTQMGYIVVSVDGRGTEPRGEAFRKVTYMELGKYEAMDQIEAARYLGTLAYVDKNRIGIFGWSFGGYLSSLCLAKGNDVFKMAIAVAPVTNWKWYDTIYTERYMRTPKENNKGYEDNSPINFAHLIKGKYLLVHGIADDNVHFQHAAEMARVLVEKNIEFDQLFYPNKNHGIYGGLTRLHLYSKMTNFVKSNL